MKLIDAVMLYSALQALTRDRTPRPFAFGYAVALNLRELEPAIQGFERARQDLIDRFAQRDADGQPRMAGTAYLIEDRPGFEAAMAELGAQPVEPRLQQLDAKLLPDLDLATASALLPMIVNPHDTARIAQDG